MPSIDEIIKREVNPFAPTTFKPGNFWHEKQDAALTVDSIHQEELANIEKLLTQVAQDHISRTILLIGDSGSGKSHLLGRLKRTLNSKAFFAYIGPWPDNSYIRRHILRYTVDSLTQTPENQQESQLILWLKSLSAFTKSSVQNFWELLSSERQKFINHLKKTYQKTGIYNADNFFGVLHALTNPELSILANEWLRGDDLSEESLKKLKLKHSIESEEAAWETFSNLGRISTETQPIVLCFDQLEAPMKNEPQSIFNINTAIHNQHLKNFLVIISLTTDIYKQVINRIQMSDKARIEQVISLKPINLEQAEALWALRLQPLHQQADSPPDSPIFPLNRIALEIKFPGGKTYPRNTLELGRIEYQKYKDNLISTESKPIQLPQPTPTPVATPSVAKKILQPEQPPQDAAFKLVWDNELKKAQEKYKTLTQLSAPELIKMLQDALIALEVKEIKPKLLDGKFSIYSFSYQKPGEQEKIGVIWTEDANMKSFCSAMEACENAINKEACHTMILIRAEEVGNPKLKGYKIYQKIFNNNQNRHVKPTLTSVYYLAAYHSLVNSALANELVISGKAIAREQLEKIVRQTDIFSKFPLLQELSIVTKPSTKASPVIDNVDDVKNFLLNFIKTQKYLSKDTLIENALRHFPGINKTQIKQPIQELIQRGEIKIINPNDPPKEHLICYVPQK